jgi:carboxyl-terminal processing protease
VPDETMKELFTLVEEDRKENAKSDVAEDPAKKEEQLKKDTEEFEKSNPLMKLQIKALIARDIWEMNEYFRVINQDNDSFKKALEIINNTAE